MLTVYYLQLLKVRRFGWYFLLNLHTHTHRERERGGKYGEFHQAGEKLADGHLSVKRGKDKIERSMLLPNTHTHAHTHTWGK